MSSIQLKFSEADLSKIRRFQEKIPHLFEDARLRKSIGQLLASQAKENIDEGSPDGKKAYQSLSAKYERYKGFSAILIGRKKNTNTKRGVSNNKGVQNGMLRKSIDWSLGSKDTIYLHMISYGKYHQFGGDKMPARPIFSIRDENKDDIMHFIENAFNRLIKTN